MSGPTSRTIDDGNAKAWDDLMHKPAKALEDCQKLLAEAKAGHYRKGEADALLNIGWCDFHLSRLPEAFSAFSGATSTYDALGDDEGVCKALNAIGVYYHEISRMDKAIDYYTQSLDRARRVGLRGRELVAMTNIGELCLNLGNPKEALDYLLKAHEMQASQSDPELAVVILMNIGSSFLDMGNYALATEFTEKSCRLALEAKELVNASECKAILARIATAEAKFDQAETYLQDALALAKKVESPRLHGQMLIAYGGLLLERGRTAEAVLSLEEAIALCEETKSKNQLHKAYEYLARAHEDMGDFKVALQYFKQYSHYRAEILREDTAQKVRSIQVQAEIDKAQQESEIYRLRNTELKEKSDALEEINRQIQSISEIGRKVTASLDFKTVSKTLYESLQPLIEMDFFGIALHAPEKKQLVYRDFYEDGLLKHDRAIPLSADNSFTVCTFQNRAPVLIDDKDKEYGRYLSKPSRTRGNPCQSIVCLPLTIEDRVFGCLMVQSRKRSAYSQRHLALFEALAPYIAIAVENALIHDRLEELNEDLSGEKHRLERATLKISHLANHDTLTGLPNRRLLFELMGKALDTAARTGDKVGVAFIDLDDFKPINDLYGHAAGDSALVAMAERLKSILRASDIVARVGGDEFIIVLTNVQDRADIELAAIKILDECGRPITFSGHEKSFSFSMGIAVFPDDGISIDELINKADAAMYRIKRADKHAFAFSE